jgi:hypothetical protein
MALLILFFIAFLALVAIAPHQFMQILLALMWFGMGLSVIYTLVAGLFS